MNNKYFILETLHKMDVQMKSDISFDFIITGDLNKKRKIDSVKTPEEVATTMVNKLSIHGNQTILEPCAGEGGILEVLERHVELYQLQITFNEIIHLKKQELKKHYSDNEAAGKYFKTTSWDRNNSLKMDCAGRVSVFREQFDKVIMNPPFDQAHEFLRAALHIWSKPDAEIVSLFPTYALSQLFTQAKTIISLFACKKFSIEEVEGFDCSYGAKVSLIHIQK